MSVTTRRFLRLIFSAVALWACKYEQNLLTVFAEQPKLPAGNILSKALEEVSCWAVFWHTRRDFFKLAASLSRAMDLTPVQLDAYT